MGDRRPSVEQAGPREEHPARTDAREGGIVGPVGQQVRNRAAFGLGPRAAVGAVVPPAAGHHQQVRAHAGDGPVGDDCGPVARADCLGRVGGHQRHVEVRPPLCAGPEHLEGPEGVERFEAVEQQNGGVGHTFPSWPAPKRLPVADPPQI